MRFVGERKGVGKGDQPKADYMKFVEFKTWPCAVVILSGAKNLSERPFVSLRVTHLESWFL
jgi:hypothetical protein